MKPLVTATALCAILTVDAMAAKDAKQTDNQSPKAYVGKMPDNDKLKVLTEHKVIAIFQEVKFRRCMGRTGHYNIYGGKLVSFYRNGQKRSKEVWDYGKPVTIKVWKTNGEKCPETKVAEGMGTYAWRDKYRGEIYVVHSYMDGLLHGPSIWYQDGEKKAVQNRVKGKRQGTEIKHGHDE